MDTTDNDPGGPLIPSSVPPSKMTREDWVAIYGEEVVRWHALTPAQRWRESMAKWETLMASGERLDDDDDEVSGEVESHEDHRDPDARPDERRSTAE